MPKSIRKRKEYGLFILVGVVSLILLQATLPFLFRLLAPSLVRWASTIVWLTSSILATTAYGLSKQPVSAKSSHRQGTASPAG